MKNLKSKIQNPKRNYAGEILVAISVLLLLVGVLIATTPPAKAVPLPTFGGQVLLKLNLVCLIPAPPPIFVIPIPFVFYMVGPPVPAELYYVYGVSTTYRRFHRDITAWVLGNDIPGADDLFRAPCLNRASLPDADGVIKNIGTGCPIYNPFCELNP